MLGGHAQFPRALTRFGGGADQHPGAAHGLTTEQYEKELERWDKLLNGITRK